MQVHFSVFKGPELLSKKTDLSGVQGQQQVKLREQTAHSLQLLEDTESVCTTDKEAPSPWHPSRELKMTGKRFPDIKLHGTEEKRYSSLAT